MISRNLHSASSINVQLLGLFTAVCIAVSIGGGTSVAYGASPIHPTNRPNTMSGAQNGELASTALIRVSPNCVSERAAATSLSLLIRSAERQNLSIAPRECYRSLSDQVAIYRSWSAAGNSACAARPQTTGGPIKGTSIHGWGRAADFNLGGAGFSSAGYRFLKREAGAMGWNHPGWAEPGGSACPEPWHWEWVGDGGVQGSEPVRSDIIAMVPSASTNGYALVTGLGEAIARGDMVHRGDASTIPLNWVMMGAVPTADAAGYWMVAADGGIFSFGNAAFHGSMGNTPLNKPIISMAATPDGGGYWLVGADGGVFSFGSAAFYGSMASHRINRPIVGLLPTKSGNGYWLIASDGGVFSFGDAGYFGSTGAMSLNRPVISAAATSTGNGYWLVGSDGGMFSFGDAQFFGSTGGAPPDQPVVSLTRTTSGAGYWLTTSAGQVYAYGDARYFGGA